MTAKTLEAIRFNKQDVTLEILDQLQLPYATAFIQIHSIEDAFQAIKAMKVRGAPAIAIVGAFAIAVDTKSKLKTDVDIATLLEEIDYLVTSRPTAVNLANACEEIKALLQSKFKVDHILDLDVLSALLEYSVTLYEDDLANNYRIGDNGLNYIIESLRAENFTGPFSIVTVCNTGSLATSGHGTALGIIRSVHAKLNEAASEEKFWFEQVFPVETRPYNQGAKLTTYELQYESIPFTLICDNMVTSLVSSLAQKKKTASVSAPVKFVIAGADRVVENGDSANKIGTHQLAVISSHFSESGDKIRFIIAAPNTTIDHKIASGKDIVIEERPSRELTTITGPVLDSNGTAGEKYTIGIATPGIDVWNPAFDVTPHELIDCIVTETCANQKAEGKFTLK